jgi:hypothetical protein
MYGRFLIINIEMMTRSVFPYLKKAINAGKGNANKEGSFK